MSDVLGFFVVVVLVLLVGLFLEPLVLLLLCIFPKREGSV